MPSLDPQTKLKEVENDQPWECLTKSERVESDLPLLVPCLISMAFYVDGTMLVENKC